MQVRADHRRTARYHDARAGISAGARVTTAQIQIGEGGNGIERAEAYFPDQAYAPHRHDTYAIGITISGVQAFNYRGERRYCQPGECHILHPDEAHDGASAAEGGFRYRIAYIDPRLVQQAIGGRSLPFVENPVIRLRPSYKRRLSAVWDMADKIDPVRHAELATDVADTLESFATVGPRRREPLRLPALHRVRDILASVPSSRHSMQDLEREAGIDRWTLARQFRAAFGTSPTRFRTMRQLDEVRALVRSGASLAEAAEDAGFADQCHMSRLFKQAYGLSPGKWAAAISSAEAGRLEPPRAPYQARSERSN
jgi:AraC-like DNA-binding protein